MKFSLQSQGEWILVFDTLCQRMHPSCLVLCIWYARAAALVKWAVTASPVGLGRRTPVRTAPCLQLVGWG